MPGGVRRFSKDKERPLRDRRGRGRWGDDPAEGSVPSSDDHKWSLIHMSMAGGITLGDASALNDDDKEMMLGTYSGHDYT